MLTEVMVIKKMLNLIYFNSSTISKRKQISMIGFSLSKLKHEHTLEAKAMGETAGRRPLHC